MKLALFLSAFMAVFAIAFSSMSIVGEPPAGKPGFCWSERTGPMEKGEEKTVEGRCEHAACNDDRTMSITGCGVVSLNGVVVTKADLSKPYPQCCPEPQ